MNSHPAEPNETDDIDPEEIQAASDDTPTSFTAPEVNAQTAELTEWDEPPGAAGSIVPSLPTDENETIAEELVREGTDEADREQRMAAADPDFEP